MLRVAGALALGWAIGCGGVSRSSTATSATRPGKHCPEPTPVPPPAASLDCEVSARPIDAVATCGSAPCAVNRRLDFSCPTELLDPAIAATIDGGLVLSQSITPSENLSTGRLLTVTAEGARLDDFPELGQRNSLPFSHAAVASTNGKSWVFAVGDTAISARHGTEAGWTASVASDFGSAEYAAVTGASMVSDDLGYVTCFRSLNDLPHLLTWKDGCWNDELLGDSRAYASTVATDAQGNAWSAVLAATSDGTGAMEVRLRGPDGTSSTLSLELGAWPAGPTIVGTSSAPLHLLAGGRDGSAGAPLVLARLSDGIRVLENDAAHPSEWQALVLPESGLPWMRTGDCDALDGAYPQSSDEDPCMGITSCELDQSGSGLAFDVVRTESGETFVGWLNYLTSSSNFVSKQCRGGELPGCYCEASEQSSTGTAELVLARLTDAGPVLSHFEFDLHGQIVGPSRGMAMAARGDTLLVTATLDSNYVRDLTYLEIDSRSLP